MILLEKKENLALFGGFLSSSYESLKRHATCLAYSAGWKELIPMFDAESLSSLGSIPQDPEIIQQSTDVNVSILREVLGGQMEIIQKFSTRNQIFYDERFDVAKDQLINKEFYFQDYNQLLQDTFSYLVGVTIDCCDVAIEHLQTETGQDFKQIYNGTVESLRPYADEDINLILDFVETINRGLEKLMKQEVLSAR